MVNLFGSGHFRAAAEDYLLFLDKGYSQKTVIKLVGDRFRLDRNHRQILFRGVCPSTVAKERKMKIGISSGKFVIGR